MKVHPAESVQVKKIMSWCDKAGVTINSSKMKQASVFCTGTQAVQYCTAAA